MLALCKRWPDPARSAGSIGAADVARDVLAFEKALGRAAYLVLRRRRAATGRHPAAVERASRTAGSRGQCEAVQFVDQGVGRDAALEQAGEALSGVSSMIDTSLTIQSVP